jgi:hypothetical protein
LIRRKMLKLLSPLGMLDLEGINTIIILEEENESLTSLFPKSPYIWNYSITQVAESSASCMRLLFREIASEGQQDAARLDSRD